MDYFGRNPEDTYRAFQKFMAQMKYRKACRCLEKLLKEFPEDIELLDAIVDVAVNFLGNSRMARPWLYMKIRLAGTWEDYAFMSRIEADCGAFEKAEKHLKTAIRLSKGRLKRKGRRIDPFSNLAGMQNALRPSVGKAPVDRCRKVHPVQVKKAAKPSPKRLEAVPKAVAEMPQALKTPKKATPLQKIPIQFVPFNREVVRVFETAFPLKEAFFRIDYARLGIQGGFDDLLCLKVLHGVEKYWYQIETVKKVLKQFHGRVLLADEVGLGKTVEAGMLIKEYLLRGMVRSVLILTPSPLVSQWKEEMLLKCDCNFVTTDSPQFAEDPEAFWKERLIIASIHTAKARRHFACVTGRMYDLVIVDEAHHLKNRKTLSWKLVNAIKKRFIFLLTATPIQNNLIELFNLITLLKPGQFKTERLFRQEYIQRGGKGRVPANREKLRELLREVMIRNTRSAIDLKLPKRFAATVRADPTEGERTIYKGVGDFIRKYLIEDKKKRLQVKLLLREAGSSPYALKKTLLRLNAGGREADRLIAAIDDLEETSKGKALIDILMKNRHEKKVIFTQYLKSMDHVTQLLETGGLPFVTFRGDMNAREKEAAIDLFKGEIPILVSSESGGEGRNLQFCNTLINFDLPWNPMRIEQRIGRLHRIGQRRDVFIFNLTAKETIEDHILHILETKINMFEMVIGEVEPILGRLGERWGEDREFEEIVMEIWLKGSNAEDLQNGFETLGKEMVAAKAEHIASTELDRQLLGEDYEV